MNIRLSAQSNRGGATVGYEAELWRMADALRGSMDAAEYKHVVLRPIFLKGGELPTCLSIACRNPAKMNLAIRGIDGGTEQHDAFPGDRFPDLEADYVLANAPFNRKEWGGERLLAGTGSDGN
ncbi:MAG TPA: type I restriction-modification system subunit M N-terminal domain-containing protein [Blastocatellia bacterium]|nr:type I restriction-modification system subunit M N-terminal domain-containing protein [Blastocatellia bacterium]